MLFKFLFPYKFHSTMLTFEIFYSLMYCLDMNGKISLFIEYLTTFLAVGNLQFFMNHFYVTLKMDIFTKGLSTFLTFEFLLMKPVMDLLNMFIKFSLSQKSFFTSVTWY